MAELLRLDRANRKELNTAAMHQRQGACLIIDKLLEMMSGANDMHKTLKADETSGDVIEFK
jgi:hypothetical protein